MIRRSLLLRLFALLLFLAGPVSASHPPMMTETPEPEPCHEMADSTQSTAHVHASGSGGGESHDDCDSQCTCCPGSCSGFVALTAQPTTLMLSPGLFSLAAIGAAPARTPLELLRPPKIT